ncbi:hypothetical protein MASR1M12_30890 [Erysipelotrichia bacterium]
MLSNPKVIAILVVFVLFFGFFQIGCNKPGEQSNPVGSSLESLTGNNGTSRVDFKLVFPSPEISDQSESFACSNATTTVIFKLKLLNYGNPAAPFFLISKQAPVINGAASVTFDALPTTTVIGSVHIENGKIQGFSDFHGAHDLTRGANTVALAPAGSLLPQDVVANAVEQIVASSTLFNNAPMNLVSELNKIVPTLMLDSPTAYNEIINNFANRNGLPLVELISPTMNQTFVFGTPINLIASATDHDGNISRIEFFQGFNKIGETNNSPFSCNWTSTSSGVFNLSAKAFDNNSAVGISKTVTVNITNVAPATYTVKYDGNGNTSGSVPTDNQDYQKNSTVTVKDNSGNLAKTGYIFSGWNTSPDGSGLSYAANSNFLISDNITLYAIWRQSTLIWIPGNVPTSEGNFALGRPTATYSNNSYSSQNAVDGNSMSRWESNRNDPGPDQANPHFLIVDLQQTREVRNIKVNISGWDSWKQNFSVSMSNDLNNWTQVASEIDKTGIFSYNIQPANIRYVKFSSTYSADMDQVNLYELEVYGTEQTISKYTVTYNGNGNTTGSVPIDNNAYSEGESISVAGNIGGLTRTGFTFVGWNTKADGTGVDYYEGYTLRMPAANLTLYAKWRSSELVWAPGTVAVNETNFAIGRPTASYVGNSFSSASAVDGDNMSRWSGNRNDPGPDEANPHFLIVDLQQIREVRNIKVNISGWDSWKQNFSISISNDLNNWTQVASEIDKTGIFSYNIQPADIRYVKFSSTYSADMDQVNLYELEVYGAAQAATTYTVTYNGNGNTSGTIPVDNLTYPAGVNVTVQLNTGNLTRTGYSFAGWNTSLDGKGISYSPGSSLIMTSANLTLYAVWVPNQTCSITYNGNGNTSGSVPIDSSAYLPGTTVTVKDNTGNLIKTGYIFSGWNTSADGTGGSYIAGTPLIIGSTNLTLYAKWTPNEQPPEIALLSPPNKAFGVASGTELKITFNKPVSKGIGNIAIHEKNGSLKEQISVTSSNVSVADNDLSIKLNSALTCDVFYYVTIEPGVVKDSSGNAFPGLSGSEDWSFKTMFEFSDTLTWNLEKIRVAEAWKYSTGENVVVAVLDSGVDSSHLELVGQLAPQGADFVNDGTFCQDGPGHGTHVAGIIAAKANGMGPIGVAPKAKLYISKVLNLDGEGTTFDIISGIQDAIDYGAKIINMSLGGYYYNAAYEEAVATAWNSGVIIFAAAGNEGWTPLNYPAKYSCAIAVGATDRYDAHCLFSNHGSELDFSAPGESIVNIAPSPEYFAAKSGTSMATPHVSGVAALILGKNPSYTPIQVIEALVFSSVDLGPKGHDEYFGFGRIDALNSLEYQPSAGSMRLNRMFSKTPPEKSDFTAKSFKKGELFLKLNPGYKLEDALNESGLQNAGIKLLKQIRLTNLLLLSVPPGREAEIGKKLQSLSEVVYAELNCLVKAK